MNLKFLKKILQNGFEYLEYTNQFCHIILQLIDKRFINFHGYKYRIDMEIHENRIEM